MPNQLFQCFNFLLKCWTFNATYEHRDTIETHDLVSNNTATPTFLRRARYMV